MTNPLPLAVSPLYSSTQNSAVKEMVYHPHIAIGLTRPDVVHGGVTRYPHAANAYQQSRCRAPDNPQRFDKWSFPSIFPVRLSVFAVQRESGSGSMFLR